MGIQKNVEEIIFHQSKENKYWMNQDKCYKNGTL